MSLNALTDTYRSIFFDEEWAHTLYFGWKLVTDSNGIKLLRKQAGPVTRNLILSDTFDAAKLKSIIRFAGQPITSETLVHDFSGYFLLSEKGWPARFTPLIGAARMLNTLTCVIDLSLPDETLLENMTPDTRRRIKKALSASLDVKIEHAPGPERLERFLKTLVTVAGERRFAVSSASTIASMFNDGRAMLVSNEQEYRSGAYLMIYRTRSKAYWLHGAGRGASPDVGQLLQWHAIRHLREQGFHWYDMGGVPPDPNNGIHKFKRGFGGHLTSLGNEFVARSAFVTLLRSSLEAIRTSLATVRSVG